MSNVDGRFLPINLGEAIAEAQEGAGKSAAGVLAQALMVNVENYYESVPMEPIKHVWE